MIKLLFLIHMYFKARSRGRFIREDLTLPT